MLIETCKLLYKKDPEIFKTFIDDKSMHWGSSYNFRNDKKELSEPTKIGDVYIEKHKNSSATKTLVTRMLNKYNIPIDNFKVHRVNHSQPNVNLSKVHSAIIGQLGRG